MFTGIIEKVSRVEKITHDSKGAKISFRADFKDVKIGSSIAVNGVCLTVVSIADDLFEADVMFETFNLTNLKNLKKGDFINLERALKIDSRLDGHIVSGHVDEIAKVDKITPDGFSKRLKLNCNADLIVKKGSIALNGVSLTVSDVFENGFEVSLIPETIKNTNLENLKIGDMINIEFDLFAKYIQKFLNKTSNQPQKKEITFEFLKENGF